MSRQWGHHYAKGRMGYLNNYWVSMTSLITAGAYRGAVRYVLAIFVAFAIAGGFFATSAFAIVTNIVLDDPNGGEEWRGTQTILWTATTDDEGGETVSIFLSSDSGDNFNTLIKNNVPAEPGTYAWDTTGIPDGDTYKVQVEGDSGVDFSSEDFMVDNTAPVTSFASDPASPDETGWYNIDTGTPDVTLTCEDPVVNGATSGCSGTFYSWETEAGLTFTESELDAFTSYGASITPPGDGEWVLYYYSEDNAEDKDGKHNREDVNESALIKVDTEAPEVESHTVDGDSSTNYFNPEGGDNVMPFELTASEKVTWTTVRVIDINNPSSFRTYSPSDEVGTTFSRDWDGSLLFELFS